MMTQYYRGLSAALLAGAALAGCSTSNSLTAERPEITLPNNYVFAPAAPQDAKPETYLQLLPADDPAFIAFAGRIDDAPDIAVALARVDSARAAARRARAERAPNINYGANIQGERFNPAQFGAPPGVSIDAERLNIGGQFEASWDPDIFGRLRSAQKAAALRVDAADSDAQAVRLAFYSELALAIADWQTLEQQATALRANQARADENFSLISQRVRAGLNPGSDALDASALVDAVAGRMQILDGERAAIVGRLVALTALDGASVQRILERSTASYKPAPAINSAPSLLLVSRPDIQAAARRLAASDADLAATAARRYPQFNLSSTVGLLAFAFGGLFDTDAIVGNVGLGVAGPLLDFGRIAADIDRDKALTQEAFALLRQTVYTSLGEAESAFGLVQATDQQIASLQKQVDTLREATKLRDTRFRAGLDDFTLTIIADRQTLEEQERLALAQGQAMRARIQLWQSLGGPGADALVAAKTPQFDQGVDQGANEEADKAPD